ncbi:MAG: hypothetical protein PVF17_01540 [Ignavibacteria bacterium]|jgi:hypothetical protein
MYHIYSSKCNDFIYAVYKNSVIYDKDIKKLFDDDTMHSAWIRSEIKDKAYGFRYLFSCNSYEDALQNYPEYFI